MIKVGHMHVWKCFNKTIYIIDDKKIRASRVSPIIIHVKEQESLSFKPVILSVQEKEMNLGVLSCTYAVGLKSWTKGIIKIQGFKHALISALAELNGVVAVHEEPRKRQRE